MVSQVPPTQSQMLYKPYIVNIPPSVAALAQTAANPMAMATAVPAPLSTAAPTPAVTAAATPNPLINTTTSMTNPNPHMNFTPPNVGVVNPPNKSDLPLSPDAFEEKDKLPSLPNLPKKGQTGLNLVFLGQIIVGTVAAVYLGKCLKSVGSKLKKLLGR